MICWKCKETIESIICVGCSTIQPPPPKPDFFAILSLQPTFFITVEEIGIAHRQKIRLVHPDRFVKKTAVERRMSLQWTAILNEAKRVLSQPNIRARYIATGEVHPKEVGGPRLDADFLELIFDAQMELGMNSSDNNHSILSNIQNMKQERLDDLHKIFIEWEKNKEKNKQYSLERVELILAEMKYLDNILDTYQMQTSEQ